MPRGGATIYIYMHSFIRFLIYSFLLHFFSISVLLFTYFIRLLYIISLCALPISLNLSLELCSLDLFHQLIHFYYSFPVDILSPVRPFLSKMDTLGIEPRASRMLSGCDTTTPCAQMLVAIPFKILRLLRADASIPIYALYGCLRLACNCTYGLVATTSA